MHINSDYLVKDGLLEKGRYKRSEYYRNNRDITPCGQTLCRVPSNNVLSRVVNLLLKLKEVKYLYSR